MEINDLRSKTISQLDQIALDIKGDVAGLWIKKNQLDNKKTLKKRRKDLARVLTIISEKEVLAS